MSRLAGVPYPMELQVKVGQAVCTFGPVQVLSSVELLARLYRVPISTRCQSLWKDTA